VEVHGKVRCSFKPDYKVLITLIYSEDQPEGPGDTTALDLHDGSFKGKLAFTTFVSYDPATGRHNCGRTPKTVLVRLVAADGTEWDREELVTTEAFVYDEKKGQYALRSGLVLHGWCQSQCGGPSHDVPTGWHKVDAGPFSILAPSGWEFNQLEGVDSFVGEFVGDGVTLRFDFGRYSNPLKEEKKPAYVVIHKSIGGFHAKVVSPRTPGNGITGVYFRDVGHATELSLWGKDLTSTQQELALKIFETIRFGGPPPRYVLPPTPKNPQ
jgi:hypothetical protein